MKSANSRQGLLQLIRSFILLLTSLSSQSLLLLSQANFAKVTAQVTPNFCAVPGNDGLGGTLNGTINTYYPGATNSTASANATSIPINNTPIGGPAIQKNDLLLIIQMQGVDFDSSNSSSYGNPTGPLNIAGQYEYVVVDGPVSGSSVPIRGAGSGSGLINTYINADATSTQGQRRYQVIRVPQYASATLGTLTAPAWDGQKGGIVVFDVAGDLNLGSGTVDVSGKGFRGGGGNKLTGSLSGTNADYVTLSTSGANGSKGEGTAGTPRYIFDATTKTVPLPGIVEGYPNGSFGRGAPGNAGGGSTDGDPTGSNPPKANDENSGAGGGSNGGAGGQGGKSWFSGLDIGGFGGAAFPATSDRLVLGGGGGAGTTNEGTNESPAQINDPSATGIASSGAPGGGMVLLRTNTVSGNGTIKANGANAYNVGQDGGGGGGAGGSVVLSATNNSSGFLSVQAKGGQGGSVRFSNNSQPNNGAHGPGGGGGGGVVLSKGISITNDASGGDAGLAQDKSGTIIDPTNSDTRSFGAKPGGAIAPSAIAQIPGIKSGAECVPQLTVNKTTSTPGPIIKPGKAIYTVRVSNAADRATATNITISDPLLSGFTFDGSTAPTVTLTGGATRSSSNNPSAGAIIADFGNFDIPGGGAVEVTFSTDIANTVADGLYQNGAIATYLDPARTTLNGTVSSIYDEKTLGEEVAVGTAVPPLPPAPPGVRRLRGVKRITNITRNGVLIPGVDFNTFVDDPNDENDNAPGWVQLSPVGIPRINPQFLLQSGDEVEYTIYFLADGNQPIINAKFCDPIPTGTTFVNDSFGSGSGIFVNFANTITPKTSVLDGDNGSFFSPVAPLSANNVCSNQTNPTGAVVVNLGDINNATGSNFGFVRFRVKLD
jgi:uncharacterized repeat protein (TIGR01451 family)